MHFYDRVNVRCPACGALLILSDDHFVCPGGCDVDLDVEEYWLIVNGFLKGEIAG